jgi:hypothetical protein
MGYVKTYRRGTMQNFDVKCEKHLADVWKWYIKLYNLY